MPRPHSEDGYELWLRYRLIDDPALLAEYRAAILRISFDVPSPTLLAARDELRRGLNGLLGQEIPLVEPAPQSGSLTVTRLRSIPTGIEPDDPLLQEGCFRIHSDTTHGINIWAFNDIGILYGVFRLLRHLQTHKPLRDLAMMSAPRIKYRLLNHWDNLDGTIERGYAGFSLWDWHKLPDYVAPRCIDYARANASIGINGAVLNNPNAKALSLTTLYLIKAAALADVFRPYGIRVYLSARFSAPLEIGALATADPLDPAVIAWWQAKADEIYGLIPDFGGFLVKANSEGQPGPRDYGRTQAQGAQALASALALHGGIVFWRAFIYDDRDLTDRAKQAYDELVPQDGTFSENAILQVKNGPLDFQPREPYHPLFGAMPKTPLSLEVQITQEYLGQATHLCYLAPLFKEALDADTFAHGAGSNAARVVDGSLDDHALSAIAGVSNIGSDRNWCGHPFAAVNWFAFGRLAWDRQLTPEAIADDWLRMTFSHDEHFVAPAKAMMLASREAVVSYMTPLGLHHLMASGHHYGPAPWFDQGRADWTSVYYHRADAVGLGFDRTSSGSGAVRQYNEPYRTHFASLDTCPEELLLWFHHVPWDHIMKSERTLWEELCFRYQSGVESVRQMEQVWDALTEWVDPARFAHVTALLAIQLKEARWWRDACLLYFQTFSKLPLPSQMGQPAHPLEYYQSLQHYCVPGISETSIP